MKNVKISLTAAAIVLCLSSISEAQRIDLPLVTRKSDFKQQDVKQQAVTFSHKRDKGKGGSNQEKGQELPTGMCLVEFSWHETHAIRTKGNSNCNVELVGNGIINMPKKVYCGCRLEPTWDGDAGCSQAGTMYMVDCSIWLKYAMEHM